MTVNIKLTSAMAAEVAQPGVEAWAVYFTSTGVGTTGPPVWTRLSGTSATALTDFPSVYAGAKVYFIVQDRGVTSGTTTPYLPSVSGTITAQGDINYYASNTTDSKALNYRFDSFELTLSQKPDDEGNLTNVNGFGIPMEVKVDYVDSGSATRGYNLSGGGISGQGGATSTTGMWGTLVNSGGAIVSYFNSNTTITGGTSITYALAGDPRAIPAPTTVMGNNKSGAAANIYISGTYASSNWNNYIDALYSAGAMPGVGTSTSNQLHVAGYFNGAATTVSSGSGSATIWHNGGFYSYVANAVTAGGSVTSVVLTPDSQSEIQGAIVLTLDNLANSIYSTLGLATVSGLTGSLYNSSGTGTIGTGDNSQYGAVLRDFFTGFTGGYYLMSGVPVNSLLSGNLDLNKEWNWDPTYAFQSHTVSQTTYTGLDTIRYDPYAKVFYDYTDSYGAGYSDNLMKALSVGPLINLSDGSGGNVDSSDITVTLFADNEQTSGYATPKIYNYISGGTGGYVTPTQFSQGPGDSINVQLNLTVGTMTVKEGTPVYISFMNNAGSSTGQVSGTSFATYAIVSGGGGYSANSATSQPFGNMNFTGLPVSVDNTGSGVNWYQITVGSGTGAKTFNMYLSAVNSTIATGTYAGTTLPTLVNAAYVSGGGLAQPGAMAIDGLALIQAPAVSGQYTNAFTVNFFPGGATSLDPSLLVPVLSSQLSGTAYASSGYHGNLVPFQTPYAPVLGVVNGGTFSELYAPQHFSPVTTNGSSVIPIPQPSSTQTVSSNNINFGWQGADNAKVLSGTVDVSAYTNKINGGHVAHITISTISGTAPVTHRDMLTVAADNDGQWTTTAPVHFGNGTYTVFFDEYLASDTTFSAPVAKQSTSQTFIVSAAADPVVSSGQTLIVSSGQTDSSYVVQSGGTVDVDSGGVMSAFTFSSGAIGNVNGSATWTIVGGGASANVSSGGRTSGTVVDNGGFEHVHSGGVVSITDVHGGGQQIVSAGGTARGTVVSANGSSFILGTASNTTVLSNGWQVVSSGGVASGTMVVKGGEIFLRGGTANGTTVSSGGQEKIGSGSVASGATLLNGGQEVVYSSGRTSAATVSNGGAANIYEGGAAVGAVVSNGGALYIYESGGTASGTTVSSGGEIYVRGGIGSSAIVSSGGQEKVGAGGTTTGTTLLNGGQGAVYSTGLTSAMTVSNGGVADVYVGGVARVTTVLNGGEIFLRGGTASGTVVSSGGQEKIGSGGVASGAALLNGGQEVVYSSGRTSAATISNGGAVNIYEGGAAISAVVSNGGALSIFESGGTATGTTVSSGGEIYVRGGIGSGTIVSSGGQEKVGASGTTAGTTVLNGGQGAVYATGRTSAMTVSNGGAVNVYEGGVASGTTIMSGGTETVSSGGTASGATLSGGTLEFLSGSTASGTITFGSSGLLRIGGSGTFGGTIAGMSNSNQVIDLINIAYSAAVMTSSYTDNGTSGTLFVSSGGSVVATLALLGQYSATSFKIGTDGHGGTQIVDPPTYDVTSALVTSG